MIKPENPNKTLLSPEQAKSKILELLEADKAEEIVVIDLVGKTSIADYMIIANGRSSRHVAAMAGHMYDKVRPQCADFHVEGQDKGDWVLIDTGDVIVHLFRPEVRDFYKVEKLWTDPESWANLKPAKDSDNEPAHMPASYPS